MSVKTGALAICIARIHEKIEQVYEQNEGFDGEITAEQLADMIYPSARPSRPATPKASTSTSKSSGRKSAKCKYCGSEGLKWTREAGGRWQLLNADGSDHRCRSERPAREPEERVSREHWHGLVRTFTTLKEQGVPRNEAADALEYDAEETPAPKSVIEKAINQVYGREEKQLGFAEALKAIGE